MTRFLSAGFFFPGTPWREGVHLKTNIQSSVPAGHTAPAWDSIPAPREELRARFQKENLIRRFWLFLGAAQIVGMGLPGWKLWQSRGGRGGVGGDGPFPAPHPTAGAHSRTRPLP